jgi:hypothetical protein
MRYILGVIVIVGLAMWLFAPRLSAVPPNGQLRGFTQRLEDNETLKKAAAAGKLHEDPQRRALRQAILRASSRVVSSPCDPRLRQTLRDAFDAYHRVVKPVDFDPVETFTLKDGTVIEAERYFQGPADDAKRSAEETRCASDRD